MVFNDLICHKHDSLKYIIWHFHVHRMKTKEITAGQVQTKTEANLFCGTKLK